MRIMKLMSVYIAVLSTIGYLLGGSINSAQAGNQTSTSIPAIAITEVPPFGEGGPDLTFPIGGTVRGVDPSEYKVVIYAFAGGTWWVQPWASAPLTDIGANSTWQTDTHRGFQYAALLVKKTYLAKAKVNILPTLGGDVVAVDRKPSPGDQPGGTSPSPANVQKDDLTKPVVIMEVPPVTEGGPDQMFQIAGIVHIANPADYKVVIYAFAGGRWWVQPWANAPFTDIEEDGRWQTETHGGSQYAALLVRKTYEAKATLSTLPKVEGNMVAIDRKPDGGGVLRIAITMVPPFKDGSATELYRIEGTVGGVEPADHKVVIYAYAGGTWWVQPFANASLTDIGEDGKWHTQIHPGLRYAALLVKNTYQAKDKVKELPKVDGDVLAMDLRPTVEPRVEPPKIIRFSGYDWVVKTSSNRRVGPGPNYFSEDSVFVDDEGLHLRVFSRNGKYFCGEIISKRSFGYGSYHFIIDSNIDDLDPNVVLGMFTWSDDSVYSHREIDIEISSWGKVGNDNAQYVIQPYTRKDNIIRFAVPQGLKESSFSFLWKQESVMFQGNGLKKGAGEGEARVIFPTHTFTEGIPQAGNENARINLWLVNGRPSGEGKKEILIREFRFEPLP